MSYMQIGELYLVKEYCWFLFPTKELATVARVVTGRVVSELAAWNAEWLSQEFKCNVSVVEPKTYVVLLQTDHDYYKLLDCNGNIGWTWCSDFSQYFDIVKAK